MTKKCPFIGNVSIGGQILSGMVRAVICQDYLHYNHFEKPHKNVSMHLSPCFKDVQISDIVTVGEC